MLGQPIALPQPIVVGVRLTGAHAGRDDRDRPRADAHADAPCARCGRALRRVHRRRAVDVAGRRPRDAVQHVPRVRGDERVLPDRRADARVPAVHRPAATPRTGPSATRRSRACSGWTARPRRRSASCSSWTSARSNRRSPGPKRPQDRVSLPDVWHSFVAAFHEHAIPDPKAKEIGEFMAEGGTVRQDRLPGRRRPLRRGGRDRRDDASRRLRRDRRDHLVHEHLEPLGDGRGGAAREARGRGGRAGPAVGQDLARARARASSPITSIAPGSRPTSRSSGSGSSGTAVRRASGTPGR